MSPAPTILLIDDHALLRAGVRAVLATGIPNAVLWEAGTMSEATAQSGRTPNLVLLDVELPGLSGLEGIALLRARWPETPVIMLSMHADTAMVRSALERGAVAFASKTEPLDNIVALVRDTLCGKPVAGDPARELPQLTPRQYEVLDLMCQGLSNKGIARRLGLAENTVRVHVQSVLAQLRVASRWEAMVVARQRGLVS